MRRITIALAAGAAALMLAACGSSGSSSSGQPGNTSASSIPKTGKRGGTLTVLTAADVDYIDPGQTYYAFGYMVHYAVNRGLYSLPPGDAARPVPDIATGKPEISKDLKTVTVHLKRGIRYAPPVNREVQSKDIKYAFERAFSSHVPNPYAGAYFSDLVGAPKKPGAIKDIPGIETPDAHTIVFKLTKPSAVTVASALTLPISTPVPKEYAARFDKTSPSTYDQYVAFTGPYMIVHDKTGKLTGRKQGRSIDLVRNPNWNRATDYRPAYLDAVHIDEGNTDATLASRRILNGSHLVSGDGAPPAQVVKQALSHARSQIAFVPGGSNRYVALNTKVKPFDDINVRKAVLAAFDRTALRLTRGGAVVGDIATHFIPPGVPGFEEAGGVKGPGYDFLRNPRGDMNLAKEYMKKAGYPTGTYTGKDELLMVATNADPGKKTAEVAQQQFLKLGFKLNFRVVPQDVLYTKFCGVPSARVAICPNVGWSRDFVDPQAILDATFNGKHIIPQGNVNWPQLDDPAINAAMAKAARLPAGAERWKAWGKIDDMVTGAAVAVPWVWDLTPVVESRDVQGVTNTYSTDWDLNFTSLK